ncbi:Transmembrane protein 63C [Morus notabilis]|uniref:Transmembrane protein 63C n=1 Tax=Morus notabilis TaxID=981085 RepID=W9SKG5_9ROSA|nr:CSC1-like protein At4g35870 [Morus notabilis]EXC35301.1 Transmembrane protein 63C [Morus notabilis]
MELPQLSLAAAVPPFAAGNGRNLSPPPSPDGGEDYAAWYGNIQYLLNISAIGAFFCVFIFVFVKLRSDHNRMPGPSALAAKLLAVWHATGREIARHCGADAAQFLLIEGGSCGLLLSIAVLSILVMLPLNLYAGKALLSDEFSKTTIIHIDKGSALLWIHFLFVVVVVIMVHFGISAIEERSKITRFRDGNGNLSDPTADSTSIFTVMVQGIPKTLGSDRTLLQEYFQHKYPGKVFRVILPMDLCALDDLAAELVRVRDEITWLVARMDSRLLPEEVEHGNGRGCLDSLRGRVRHLWKKVQNFWDRIMASLGYTDEERLRKLQELRAELETELAAYKEGCALGAGVAFVVFKDVYTTNKAVQDFRNDRKRRIGKFFSLVELRLQRNQWKVERAPLATDIYWNHLGSSKMSLRLRRVIVNTCLLLMLLFFSSPLAVISAVKSAGRIINAEAMDNAQLWLVWVQSSSWLGSLIFQFLPNVMVFVSMYIVIPSALSYLSKFERHLTVSGEQRAALLKMVCFFLVNLILLRGLVESSLESTILRMGRCYLDGEDCKRIEQYMSGSFLSRSCLSSLAFLITSTFLGISYDLLAPVPWIKRKLQKFRKNDMLQLVPEQTEEYQLENQETDGLQRPLVADSSYDSPRLDEMDSQGQDLSVYPINRTSTAPKQTFDFAQYYAFNLTIFALTLIYSSFAPLVVPVGAVYFGYRYVVDKYNFLFVYRVQGFPAGNDGKLMDTVLCIMRFCVDLFLVSMLLFFSVQGDSTKLQAIFTLGLLVMYKLLPSHNDGFQPALLGGMQTVDSIVDGPLDYEIFSQPKFDWDVYYS